MPGPITHLKVAYEFLNGRNDGLYSAPQLLLGSVSPDSVNIYGHAPKSERWPAHLRNADLDIWLNNAASFYNDNLDFPDRSFLCGYIIHIVTDIVWDRCFDKKLFLLMAENGVLKERFKEERWQEIYGFENRQRSMPWVSEVLAKLSVSTPQPLGTVQPEKLAIWRDMIVSGIGEKGHKPMYLNGEFMDEFVRECLFYSENIIK